MVVVAAALAAPAVAAASKLIVRNATHITLKVNAKNRAVVSYHANGIVRHVLVWGAINAKPPKYAEAVALLTDLKDLARQDKSEDAFTKRLGELRDRHAAKRALLQRIRDAALT